MTSLRSLCKEFGFQSPPASSVDDVILMTPCPSLCETTILCAIVEHLIKSISSHEQHTWLLTVWALLIQRKTQGSIFYCSLARVVIRTKRTVSTIETVLGEALASLCPHLHLDTIADVGVHLFREERNDLLLAWLTHTDPTTMHAAFARAPKLHTLLMPPKSCAEQACLLMAMILARAYQTHQVPQNVAVHLRGKWQTHWEAHISNRSESASTRLALIANDKHIATEQLYERVCNLLSQRHPFVRIDFEALFGTCALPLPASYWTPKRDLVLCVLWSCERLSPRAIDAWGAHIREVVAHTKLPFSSCLNWSQAIDLNLRDQSLVPSSRHVWTALAALSACRSISMEPFTLWTIQSIQNPIASNSKTLDVVRRIAECGYDTQQILWKCRGIQEKVAHHLWLSVDLLSWEGTLAIDSHRNDVSTRVLAGAYITWKTNALMHVDAWLGRDVTTLVAGYLEI
jgi:hypothetical protein